MISLSQFLREKHCLGKNISKVNNTSNMIRPSYSILEIQRPEGKHADLDEVVNSVDTDEVAHNKPPHLCQMENLKARGQT